MKKFLAGLFLFFAVDGKAQLGPTVPSTFTIVGLDITSGTVIRVNSRPAGFGANIAFYRFINNHATTEIFLGGISLTTAAAASERLAVANHAGGRDRADWPVGKDHARFGQIVPIYAQAADSASATDRPKLSVLWFGY